MCKMASDQPFPLKKAYSNQRSNLSFVFRKSKFHPLGNGMDMPDGASSGYFFSSRGVRLISSAGIRVISNFSRISSP